MRTPKCIVHISNDYSGSTVYKNLVKELDEKGMKQVVYNPIRDPNKFGVNSIHLKVKGSRIVYSPILNWHVDRIFYPYKIYKIYKDIQSKVDFKKVAFIHAHTWYSDGGVAYLLSKKYNVPFILAVRNTDLNLFQRKLFYLRPFGRKIIQTAKGIVLISASYKYPLWKEGSLQRILEELKAKTFILPNGVDPYWIDNVSEKSSRRITNDINLIYVGTFTRHKRLAMVQQAIIQINNNGKFALHLHIVGGGGNDEEKVLELAEKHASYFTHHGRINNKEQLKRLYMASDIFVMPSKAETFGLVYVEAMLQGLPILYTEGQGIDGFYSEKIGEKVTTSSVDEIQAKLELMIEQYEKYEVPLEKIKSNHDWKLIATRYIELYYD